MKESQISLKALKILNSIDYEFILHQLLYIDCRDEKG